jgi:RNA-directed DNA polymerase
MLITRKTILEANYHVFVERHAYRWRAFIKLRCILWRQWKRPHTQRRELCRRGIDAVRASASSFNGRGPWWNAGASHMSQAVPTKTLTHLGLMNYVQELQRFARTF